MKNKFLKAMRDRYACKEFDPAKKITVEDFEYILEVGRLSPSSFGFEPWKFLVVQDIKKREKVTEVAWGAKNKFPGASHFLVVLAKKKNNMKFDSKFINHMMTDIQKLPEEIIEMKGGAFKKFQEEDFKLLESDRAIFDWASKQTYIPFANMMTAAAAIGIDSCPIEGFEAERTNEILGREFGVDTSEYGISYMIAFGYRADKPFKKTRQPMENIVEWH